jgi:hypothetical protein
VYVCMFICVCVCVCIYIYIYVYILAERMYGVVVAAERVPLTVSGMEGPEALCVCVCVYIHTYIHTHESYAHT